MVSMEELNATVVRVVQATLEAKGTKAAVLTRDTPVDQRLGLDSLDWATVVVQLEDQLGVDPFAEGIDHELRTLGDFLDLYASVLR